MGIPGSTVYHVANPKRPSLAFVIRLAEVAKAPVDRSSPANSRCTTVIGNECRDGRRSPPAPTCPWNTHAARPERRAANCSQTEAILQQPTASNTTSRSQQDQPHGTQKAERPREL